MAVGCDVPSTSPRPSPSLIEVEFTQRPTALSTATPAGSITPTLVSWPVGWDVAFCRLLGETVIAHELVIDVQRALDEGNQRDARLLAQELRDTAAAAQQSLAELADWQPAEDAVLAITTLLDLDARAGEQYGQHFAENSRAALRRARSLRREVAAEVPEANTELASLGQSGLSCPGINLQLETL